MTIQLRRQAGLTLVELMVATTLSLVLLSGVLLVFSANKTTYQMQTGLGTLQENGRYAIRQITDDLQMAGFGGCLSPSISPRIAMLVASPPAFISDFAGGEFFGGRNNQSGTFTYGGVTMTEDTDSIEIRGPLRSGIKFVTGEIVPTGTVDVVGTNSGVAANEYVMIGDCAGADVFRATAVATGSGNTQITHGTSLNTQASLSRRYGADSVVSELMTHTYFIGNTGRTNTSGQAVSALYRFDGANSQELVDGVEDLQVEYALDTNNDDIVDTFQNPGGVTNWDQVKSVSISLLLNSVNAASTVEANYTYFPDGASAISPATGDLRLRQEFSSMISVRNSVL